MKSKICTIVFMSLTVIVLHPLSAAANGQVQKAELELEARSIIQKFAGTLKPLLKGAIRSGGLDHAITICANQAPIIAQQLSRETGWTIKRVSLKPRNNKNAIADPFEQKILRQFNQRQINGELPESIIYSEIVGNRFRYMKAQGVEDVCLHCHGENLNADVAGALKRHYPDDTATGYSKGQIRGAFSLIKNLDGNK
jgi:hypothetical protein